MIPVEIINGGETWCNGIQCYKMIGYNLYIPIFILALFAITFFILIKVIFNGKNKSYKFN